MKKAILPFFLLFVSLFNVQAQTTADEAAIKAVAAAETRAWLAGDKAAHAACWQVRPYSRAFISLADGSCIDLNADNLNATNEAMGGGGSFENSNYRIHIENNMAWMTYDQVAIEKNGIRSDWHESRILERVGGKWKIVGMTVHHYKP